jgi:hypothetical protein
LWRWFKRQAAERFAWIDALHRLDWKNDRGAFLELRTSLRTTGGRRGLKTRGGKSIIMS